MNVQRVSFDVHAHFSASDHVSDDVAEAVPCDLIRPNLSPADHLRHESVIMRELIQLVIPIQVRSAVPNMDDTQLCVELERHRNRRAHPAQFRVLRRFLKDARVSFAECLLELGEDPLGLGRIRVEEPLERIECELLDGDDRKGAGVFAGAASAHAVGDEKQVAAFHPELRLRFRQARLPDAHGFGEFSAEELILIGWAHAPLVSDSESLHRQRAVFNLRIRLTIHGHVSLVRGAR
jgi:hypothetical protein